MKNPKAIIALLVIILPLTIASVGTMMLIPYAEVITPYLAMFLSIFAIITAVMAVIAFLFMRK